MALTVKKETKTFILDNEGNPLEAGSFYYFVAGDRVLIGSYQGIASRGALVFKGFGSFDNVTFNVMPKSIEAIYPLGNEGKVLVW